MVCRLYQNEKKGIYIVILLDITIQTKYLLSKAEKTSSRVKMKTGDVNCGPSLRADKLKRRECGRNF